MQMDSALLLFPCSRASRMVLAVVCALAAGTAAAYSDDPAFDAWLEGVRAEAAQRGLASAAVQAALANAQQIDRVIELDQRQPELTQTFWRYVDARVTEARIAQGQMYLDAYGPLLSAISARWGVPPQVLVALWGLESDFGRIQGDFEVVSATATLAYESRRGSFFRQQLLAALELIDRGDLAPDVRGSWAGAIGQPQFIPTTIRAYAVDYDGDGRRDLAQHRHAARQPVDIAHAEVHLGLLRSGQQVQDGVGGAAHRDVERHRVLERLERGDGAWQHAHILLLVIAAGEVDDEMAGLHEQPLAIGMGRQHRAVAGQRQAERLGQAVHRIGGEHARARAAGRAGRALDGGYVGIAHLLVGRGDHGIDQIEGGTGFTASEVRRAINAGIDMVMVPDAWKSFIANTIAQVKSGEIPQARIDEATGLALAIDLDVALNQVPAARAADQHGGLVIQSVGLALVFKADRAGDRIAQVDLAVDQVGPGRAGRRLRLRRERQISDACRWHGACFNRS